MISSRSSGAPSMASRSPHFAAAPETGRTKRDPLLVAAVHDAADISRLDVKLVDAASGAIVAHLDRQTRSGGNVAAAGSLIFLPPPARGAGAAGLRVLDPATGAVTTIHAAGTTPDAEQKTSSALASYVFGQLPSTGDYKVLRISTSRGHHKPSQSCEILTLGGGRDQRWRPAPSPPVIVGTTIPRHTAVTQGFAHFLTTTRTAEHDGIATLDMAKEEWRPSLLQGPLSSKNLHCCHDSLSLVELNGCLVFVHHDYQSRRIDMWVLADLEKGRWLAIQSLDLGSILYGCNKDSEPEKAHPFLAPRRGEIFAQPLMVLDDGRIVFWVRVPNGVVKVYDPKTRVCKEFQLGRYCSIVGLYNGSRLGFP